MSENKADLIWKALSRDEGLPAYSKEYDILSVHMKEDDKQSVDMICVYFELGKYFEARDKAQGSPQVLEPEELVNVIKSHNEKEYAKLTFEMCTDLYKEIQNPGIHEHPKYKGQVQPNKWIAVRVALIGRKWRRDETNQHENEAQYIYHTIVKEADELKAAK